VFVLVSPSPSGVGHSYPVSSLEGVRVCSKKSGGCGQFSQAAKRVQNEYLDTHPECGEGESRRATEQDRTKTSFSVYSSMRPPC
jgi:hypothetical protein